MRCNLLASKFRTSLLAVAIVVPSVVAVNHFTEKSIDLRVDGVPTPPLPPPKDLALVADGIPVPPLPPKETILAADGIPVPPLPPKGEAAASLSA